MASLMRACVVSFFSPLGFTVLGLGAATSAMAYGSEGLYKLFASTANEMAAYVKVLIVNKLRVQMSKAAMTQSWCARHRPLLLEQFPFLLSLSCLFFIRGS